MRNKAERLAVAAAIAPALRTMPEEKRKRRVALVDDKGDVVRYATVEDVQRSLLERAKIEIGVYDDRRPEKIFCEKCGVPVSVQPKGSIPKFCAKCRDGRCGDCGQKLSGGGRGKYLLRCRTCANALRAEQKRVLRAQSRCLICDVVLNTKARKLGTTKCNACESQARCGAGHPNSIEKNRPEIVPILKQRVLEGATLRGLSKEFGISRGTIRNLLRRNDPKKVFDLDESMFDDVNEET